MKQKEKMPNRLIHEQSPYLLQHAYNPVDWNTWSDDAFDKAQKENKLVFLSIGYSACHWCHVMERECFSDHEVAQVLNDHFIAIKIDREERPDIDYIYLVAAQLMAGQAGWPLNVILTPDKNPIFVGSYFPKKSEQGLTGLLEILERFVEAWRYQREELLTTGKEVAKLVRQETESSGKGEVREDLMKEAYGQLVDDYDELYGGFGRPPKFPVPHMLIFLARYWKTGGPEKALSMVQKTLYSMAKGGIFDQIGFGFSRYATDARWLIPHFEKMLNDNALLAYTYLEAYQAQGEELFSRIAREVFTYILRDMTSPEGAFYTAEDAESGGEEGRYYLWTPEEIKTVLGSTLGEKYCLSYGITPEGNFQGANIPNLISNDNAQILTIKDVWDVPGKELLKARQQREAPLKDDKILSGWNGLMIASLARGSWVLEKPEYAKAAAKAVDFLKENLLRKDGRLMAAFRKKQAVYPAYLSDYAFLVWGLLELYRATFETEYLGWAWHLNEEMLHLFGDENGDGLFLYGKDSEELIARPKEIYDGAVPSGNSVAALNLLRLSRLTGDRSLEKTASRHLEAFAGKVARFPRGYCFYLLAILYRKHARQVVIAGEKGAGDTQQLLEVMNKNYFPHTEILLVRPEDRRITELVPQAESYKPLGGKATAYVCRQFSCQEPVTEPEQLKRLLQ